MFITKKQDRKSTRLNSSHSQISYAVFCLKKKKNNSIILHSHPIYLFFFFNDTATTEIYTLSLHDALPISRDNYRFSAIVMGIVRSAPFQMRKASEEGLSPKP